MKINLKIPLLVSVLMVFAGYAADYPDDGTDKPDEKTTELVAQPRSLTLSPDPVSSANDLPDTVLSTLFDHLNEDRLKNATLVCKKWHHFISIEIRSIKVRKDVSIINLVQLSHRFPNIIKLTLGQNDQVTDDGIAPFTKLTTLNLGQNKQITDVGVSTLTTLAILYLGWNEKITDAGISLLTGLRLLDLGWNGQISDFGIMGLTVLQELNLAKNSRISDTGISGLVSLTALDVNMNRLITNAGILPLTRLTTLKTGQNKQITKELASSFGS